MDVDLDHPAIAGYLARLEAAAAHLPDWRREELVAEIRSHVNEALVCAADDDDAAVYAAVDRLGDPADIVAAEGGSPAPAYGAPGAPPPSGGGPGYGWQPAPAAPARGLGAGWGPVELIAVIGLAIGVLTGGLGLLIGVICTWISDRWTTREKIVATVLSTCVAFLIVIPALFLVGFSRGTGGSSVEVSTPVPVISSETAPGGTP